MNEPEIDLATHGAIVEEFVTGLVAAFGLSGRVESEEIDDETREVRVEGAELGVMVGPKGATLSAIQELSRSVIHRRVTGTAAGRVRLDVAGYRQRRREALERFARTVAEDVRTSGVQKALEPMSAPDRKIVGLIVEQALSMGIVGFTVGLALVLAFQGYFPRRIVVFHAQ